MRYHIFCFQKYYLMSFKDDCHFRISRHFVRFFLHFWLSSPPCVPSSPSVSSCVRDFFSHYQYDDYYEAFFACTSMRGEGARRRRFTHGSKAAPPWRFPHFLYSAPSLRCCCHGRYARQREHAGRPSASRRRGGAAASARDGAMIHGARRSMLSPPRRRRCVRASAPAARRDEKLRRGAAARAASGGAANMRAPYMRGGGAAPPPSPRATPPPPPRTPFRLCPCAMRARDFLRRHAVRCHMRAMRDICHMCFLLSSSSHNINIHFIFFTLFVDYVVLHI